MGRYLFRAKRELRGVVRRSFLDGGTQDRDLATGFRKDADALREKGLSRAAAVAQALAERYGFDAEHEDSETAEFRDP
ncbi:hypothetical protein QEG98_33710 [Myxococcus sp. MxC21-1]|uniref:hypothetical protein n=1 Tax=Myxococcus sp. MxC21-1 TaxID=3041439 RepID=UPI0029300ED4|nr:hypothetical protein [Myxococcus sp. MxC21-1]WNZ60846.1 hypothetical protein QEG98_33710 [Myxococcus sp. MxC21-1]